MLYPNFQLVHLGKKPENYLVQKQKRTSVKIATVLLILIKNNDYFVHILVSNPTNTQNGYFGKFRNIHVKSCYQQWEILNFPLWPNFGINVNNMFTVSRTVISLNKLRTNNAYLGHIPMVGMTNRKRKRVQQRVFRLCGFLPIAKRR